jgi:hypothetical protein
VAESRRSTGEIVTTRYLKTFTSVLRDDNGKRLATPHWGDPLHDSLRIGATAADFQSYPPKDAYARVRGGKPEYRRMLWTPIPTGLVYGLVNVRTDGEHILCATIEEKGSDFDTKVFRAGVEA